MRRSYSLRFLCIACLFGCAVYALNSTTAFSEAQPTEPAEALSLNAASEFFLGGHKGSHHLNGATGYHQYLLEEQVWKFPLVLDSVTPYWRYYHEKGYTNYKWRFHRFIGSGGRVRVDRKFPGDPSWRYFQSAYLTILKKDAYGDPKSRGGE